MPEEKALEPVKEKKPIQLRADQLTRTASIFNQDQQQLLHRRTPKRFTYEREGAQGQVFTYVRGGHVRNQLNSLFGYNWNFEVETTVEEAFKVAQLTRCCVVKGVLTGKVPVAKEVVSSDGTTTKEVVFEEIKKVQFGRSMVKFKKAAPSQPVDFGNDLKGAATDALKKCASSLGIASDIYDKDEFIELDVIGASENTDRQKNIERMTEEAKKSIDEQSTKVGEENGNS